MGVGDAVGARAGLLGPIAELQELADRVEWEAELAGVADEREPVAVCSIVDPLVARGAARRG
jgi:hypothetical protein